MLEKCAVQTMLVCSMKNKPKAKKKASSDKSTVLTADFLQSLGFKRLPGAYGGHVWQHPKHTYDYYSEAQLAEYPITVKDFFFQWLARAHHEGAKALRERISNPMEQLPNPYKV